MSTQKTAKYPELAASFNDVKSYFIYAGLFSAAVNLLMLVPVIYMLQVYDRVVSSGSYSTLAMLTLLMVALTAALGGFEWVRSMILIAASNRIEKNLRRRVSDATFKRALLTGGAVSNSQPLSDLSSLRQFLTGNGLFAFFDAPWFPIYVFVMFMFHPLFGYAAIFAGIVMVALAYTTEKVTSKKLQDANSQSNWINNQVNGTLKNSEVIAAMGMADDLRHRQEKRFDQVLTLQTDASRSAGLLQSLSKTFRMVMQSLLLGLGALLALRQEISPGMMIAGSLLLGRALAPIDMLVGTWKGFTLARGQYDRLGQLLNQIPKDADTMSLPAPTGKLSAEQVMVVPPGSKNIVVRGVNMELNAGEALGIVGPSASGKSCLARALLGIWPTYSGKVRLDGADIFAWDRTELGPYIGYLPQDIELFDGSISENICRFGDVDPDKVVEAARTAGVHDLILHLPQGYDTVIGGSGGILSGGQRQRIGLARAIYGSPKYLVLDEPNSNLDDQGERELVEAIRRIKSEGATVIIITHRTMVLQCVDKILVMRDGAASHFGPRDQVLAALAAPQDKKPALRPA
ncbi:type I secretion system permease/ATPase [Gammaproteobacteria bacterium]|jgi:ATP-binding cassette subfamily C protein EexD|uniref:Peptidase n=3 Tax=OM182 clade TaxID=745002 RepID=A0A0R2T4X9_9GAMM|nr:MAG: peptidase [OM182 bacterium BACL3 MAG-120619-bin3]KRP27107.1 MAG: peptidase [OM182 bacterium BACL3 MAG-120924-bin41]MCH9855333.1 type I secretion system permease/ATPase [Gammaproteobacteria bacterium]MDP4769573.1 type I secretion system permease/ATPase [OM182 bacterium]MDA7692336.1 type I secretion system permease/ATPase [Gammaproteobacteria bacterium]